MPAPTSRSPRIRSKTPSSARPRRRERENRKDSDMTAKPATDTTAQPPAAPRPASTASADFLASLDERRAPSLGGFSATLLRLELIRKLRNRRTLIFTMIMPAVFYLIFGPTHAHLYDAHARGLLPRLRSVEQGPDARRRRRRALHVRVTGRLRGDGGHDHRRRPGRGRTRIGLEPAAGADPAAPGRLHPHQG